MNVALRPEHLNILSICTGGGGLDLGVELAIPSARTVCMVEREAFAVAQLVSAMEAGLMAPAPIWSDARTLDGRAWRGAVDGFIGGIPCQPHSLAGKKQGSNDARDLWSTARRLIIQSRAWFVLIENVAGMLSAGDDEIAGAERVYRDLLKLGFQVEGGLFTASEGGTSHQRERVFILGVADALCERGCGRDCGWEDATDAHSPSERSLRSMGNAAGVVGEDIIDRSGKAGQRVVTLDRSTGGNRHGGGAEGNLPRERKDTATAWIRPIFPPGPADRDGWRSILERAPELEPAFRRVADGLASRLDIARVDRLRMLGNGVVPLQAAYAIRTLITRLAARGPAGAARLVRMMEGIDA